MTLMKTPAVRRFIGTVAAAAMTLALMTVAAVPARANGRSDDFAKAAAAVAAIVIIGSALNDRHGSRRQDATPPRYQPDYPRRPHHSRLSPLPARCAVEVRGRRHNSVAYPENCLRRNGVDRHLPRRCEVAISGRRGNRSAYEQNCLLNSGFSLPRRRR
ncbi:hypothetical protein [Pseudorhodobacter sp.]|uniref:hypothetical protein n=1 Tax=Pseudorhodobacter sp. TaxID=1934400 RepID=UPI0026479B73|nr:hypothetical protein [Pseudorhodobacter sp.]MDN5787345.1 hypothetical protein [Pseudorhodobacter sp.]